MAKPTDAAIHLLVVDDNEISREVVTELLELRGYRITTAVHGQEALEFLAADDSIALVFMDVEMPVMGGVEATRALRDEPRLLHLPVVGLTAHSGSEDRVMLLRAGMDDVVVKPARLAQLTDAVERNLDARAAPREASPRHEPDSSSLFERSTLLATVEGDEAFLAEILRLFLDDMPTQLRELGLSIEAADREAIRRRAHTIKGASSNVSALAMRHIAQQIEEAAPADGDLDRLYAELDSTWQRTRARLGEELS